MLLRTPDTTTADETASESHDLIENIIANLKNRGPEIKQNAA